MSSPTRVLVVSAHGLFRECLTAALAAADSSFSVSSVEDAASVGDSPAQPDVLILDLQTQNGIGIDPMSKIVRQLPKTHVLVIGEPKSESAIVEYLEAGAADYRLSDDESVEELCEAIHRVLDGHVAFSPERVRALFTRLKELSRKSDCLEGQDATGLSKRELQILSLIEEGMSNKLIAAELHISLHTVKNHVHRILEKLDVHSRGEAVHMAHSNGWLKTIANHPKL